MKTNARKYISLLLALCMVMSLLPAAALAASDGNCTGDHSEWKALSGSISSLSGNCYLTGNVTVSTEIHTTGDVTLCLNGYTLNLNGKSLCVDSGSFTLYDCKGGGKITGGNDKPGVIVYGGTFIMNGGTITGNAGGVIVGGNNGSASFIMNGGSITGNIVNTNNATTNTYGGGVYVANGSSFTMTGGSITGNTVTGIYATTASGGVLVVNNGSSFTMTGGEITNNQCTVDSIIGSNQNDFAGGVCVSTNLGGGSFTVSGDAVISGNTAANGSANNVSLGEGQKINIGSGGLSSGAEIGVTMASAGEFTTGGGESCRQYFFSDNDSYVVVPSGGELALGLVSSNPHTHCVCGETICNEHDGKQTFSPLSSLETTLGSGNYYLTKNLTNDTGDHITVSGNVTLCLNGRTLDLNGHHFIVNNGGSLTICDCGRGGTITGQNYTDGNDNGNGSVYVLGGSFTMYSGTISGNNVNSGGGVYVASGSFTMYGGTISGNKAKLGGGVYVASDSSFTMHGGTIFDNEASTYGCGGVYVSKNGSFTMYDGSITNNRATGSSGGGGVHIEGSFAMSGGEISGNTAAHASSYGGGVHVAYGGSFTISGGASITGNTSGGSSCNVYLDNNTVITIAGQLTGGKIGVRMASPGVFTSGWTSKMGNAAPTNYFTSEDSAYLVERNSDGEAMLHQHGYTYTASVGTITESCTCGHSATATISIPGGTNLTYTGSAITPAEVSYSTGWQGGDLTITYSDNTNAGTATASITKNGQTAQVTFTITAKAYGESSGITIGSIDDQTYTGSAIKPEPVVKDGGTTLIKGTDYTLSYGENTNVGTNAGTVTINFTGNYSGSTTVNFNIVYAAFPSGTTNNTVFSDYDNVSGNWSNDADGVTFTSNDGWTVSTTPNSGYGGSVTFNDDTDGEHAKTVYVKDSEGHIYETEVTYKLDKTDPAVSNVDKPAEDAVWTDENVTVSFDVSDETSGIQTVTVTDKDGKSVTVTPGSEGKYNFTATENGTYTVTVTDNAGNTTTQEIEIKNIDKTAPTLSISGGMKSAEELTLTVNASNTGGSDIQSVTVQKDGGEPANIEDDSYTITAPGTYTFTATTGAGVTSTVTKTVHSVTIGTDAQLVVDGGKATKPADPTKTGYTFDCWMNDTTAWDFENGQVTDDLTLTAKWTLDAPTVELRASETEVNYGTEITLTATATHTASGNITYTYEWYKGDTKLSNADSALTFENVADSGSYTVKVTATDGTLTSAQTTSSAVNVSIGKANPVTTWPTASPITYGQSLSESDLTGGNAVDGAFAWKDGSVNPTSGSHSYTVTFTPTDTANYNSVEQSVTVQVNRATLTPSVGSVQDKVYDGDVDTTGTIELEGAVLNENPTAGGVFTFEDASAGTNKTVKVTVTLGDSWASNYVLAETELTTKANITPKTVGLTWSGHENLVYDGSAVSVTAEATGLVDGDQCAVTVENGDQTNAGTYTAEATGLGNDNYQLPDTGTTQEYTIAPRPVELSWSASSFTYDGSEKTVTATITNLVPDDVCALTYEDNAKTEHGSYTAKVTALDNANYTLTNGTDLTHSWSIGKAVVSFTVSGNSHTYDGDPKTAEVTQDAGQTQIPAGGYEVKYGGEASQTAAGTYDITVTITNSNFCFEDGEDTMVVGQLTIGEQAVTIPAADDTEFVYNGAEQTYAIAESELYTVEGNAQKDAGTYTVTVSLNDKDNYVWSDDTTDDRTYTFTISPKTVTATWVGLEQVYGSVEPVYVILSGLAEGDESLTADISGISTEAGEHPLTASLKNYDIINGTATLRIQQKPVTITVTDNAVTVGSEPAISAPGLAESDYEVVYKDKNGNEVTPSEPGTYEVWVEITNPNYRHPDGGSEKQVGSVVVSSGTPRTYEVSFAGSGGGGSTAGMKAAGGSVITLPECGFTKPGSVFTGWKYFNVVYKSGDSFTMPSGDVIFTAQWAQSQSVGGKVQDKGGAPVEGAAVSIWQGSNKLDEDVTGSNGAYSFPDLAPGSYNVSVSTGEKTVTTVVTVDENGQVTGGNIVLSEGNISTRVDVTPGSPDIVVGDLDGAFTDADKETAASGGTVEIAVKVEQKPESGLAPGEAEQLEDKADGELGLFVDISLDKTTTPSGGSAYVENGVSSEGLLTIIVPLPTELKYKDIYTVVRTDGATGEALSSEPDELSGEYYELTEDGSGLILHVKESGVYAVGGRDYQIVIPTYPPVKTESENGSFAVSPDRPFSGQTVTITPKPDEGYTVDKITVTDASGKAVEVSPNGDGTYSFTQPSGAVTITVTFKVLTDVSECPRDASCPMSGYTDLNMGEWYHDGIHYCLDEGLMDGVDAGMFAPNATTSRAMIVTILWRLQGSPEVEAEETFTDVAPGDWYADAIAWAAAEGVAEGYEDGSFRPNDAITREQLAAMLWRYAGSPEAGGDLSAFADGDDTSDWAQQAMSWAVAQGLITGVDSDRLDPKGQATRAQTATILMRFAQSETK